MKHFENFTAGLAITAGVAILVSIAAVAVFFALALTGLIHPDVLNSCDYT